jgi:hypothetical protein
MHIGQIFVNLTKSQQLRCFPAGVPAFSTELSTGSVNNLENRYIQ